MSQPGSNPTQFLDATLVLAASCAAHRVNDGYFKADQFVTFHHSGVSERTPRSGVCNRTLTDRFIAAPDSITAEDHDTAGKIQSWYRAKLFRVLADKSMSDFERRVMDILDSGRCQQRRDVGMLVSVPQGYFRAMQAEAAWQRTMAAQGGYLGTLGQRLEITCEVLRSGFSAKWNTWYITAVTPQDQVVFFSHARGMAPGTVLKAKGTVKRQQNNQTQLNRVIVLDPPRAA